MKSAVAVTLGLGTALLMVLASPACSSSSSPAGTADTGAGGSSDTGGGSGDTGGGSGDTGGGSGDTGSTGDTGGGDASCSDPADAATFFGGAGMACVTCLQTKCSSSVNACLCNASCVDGLKCLDACIADGGMASSCAVSCVTAIDSSTGGTDATNLLGCYQSNCTTECSGGGTGDSGGGEAGDAAGGG